MQVTEIPGYTLQAVTTVDNRGFTLPLSPDEGKLTEDGCPYGNGVTCNPLAYATSVVSVTAGLFQGKPSFSE